MKKQLVLLFISYLGFLQPSLQAQDLQVLYNSGNWGIPSNEQVTVTVDGCTNKGTSTFRVVSENPAEIYLREDPPFAGQWIWQIYCELYDKTTGQIVASYSLPKGAYNINASSQSDVYSVLSNIAQSHSYFEFTYNGYMIFLFENVEVTDGHAYEAHFKIVNKNNPFGGTTRQTDSWTNTIAVNGNSDYQLNIWNPKVIEPSFTDVSIGSMASNTANGEAYLIGTDGRVYNVVWANNKWNLWCLDWNFTQAASGAITVNPSNNEVYFIGTDGRVYNGVWANNQWNIWCLDWNFTQAAPGAITVNPNNGEVYFIGTDGRVYNGVWANNQWNIWCLDWNFTQAAHGAITVNSGNGEVYFIGTDSRVYNGVWTNNQWNIWCLDWNFVQAAPGAITINPGNGEVYIVGTDNRMYNCVWTNNQWNIWCIDWGFTSVAAGALACQPMSGHVNFITTDNKLHNAVWGNGQWNMWGVDNNYNASHGALGVHLKGINGSLHDMILSRDNDGRLNAHVWLNCGANKRSSRTDLLVSTSRERIQSIAVTPNPMVDAGVIRFELDEQQITSVSIFNTSGELVQSIIDQESIIKGSHSYSIGSLKPGIYLAVLQAGNGDIVTTKFIVQ